MELVGDRLDRRADDVLVEGGEEHPGHEAGEDGEDLPMGEALGGGWCRRQCRRW
jgi:hypothetical protein